MLYSGSLNMIFHSATFRQNYDLFSAMDPYLRLTVGNSHYRTRTATGQGKTPIWNQSFTCLINGEQALVVEAFDEDPKSDDYIGRNTFGLLQTFRNKGFVGEIPVFDNAGREQGRVRVSLSFVGACLPPETKFY